MQLSSHIVTGNTEENATSDYTVETNSDVQCGIQSTHADQSSTFMENTTDNMDESATLIPPGQRQENEHQIETECVNTTSGDVEPAIVDSPSISMPQPKLKRRSSVTTST